jgi:hypothetical protein
VLTINQPVAHRNECVTSDLRLFISRYGHVMAQAVNSWPFIAEAQFRSQVSPWKIRDGQSGTGKCFSPSTKVFLCCYHSTIVIFISTLLFPERPMGEGWESSKNNALSEIGGKLGRKTLSPLLSVCEGIKTMGTGSFPGVKRPGRGADHPPPCSAEVKKG